MTTRKFFIDTDTASDDAVAILMALEWENVDVNHKDIQNLKNYLRGGIWKWYFG